MWYFCIILADRLERHLFAACSQIISLRMLSYMGHLCADMVLLRTVSCSAFTGLSKSKWHTFCLLPVCVLVLDTTTIHYSPASSLVISHPAKPNLSTRPFCAGSIQYASLLRGNAAVSTCDLHGVSNSRVCLRAAVLFARRLELRGSNMFELVHHQFLYLSYMFFCSGAARNCSIRVRMTAISLKFIHCLFFSFSSWA